MTDLEKRVRAALAELVTHRAAPGGVHGCTGRCRACALEERVLALVAAERAPLVEALRLCISGLVCKHQFLNRCIACVARRAIGEETP